MRQARHLLSGLAKIISLRKPSNLFWINLLVNYRIMVFHQRHMKTEIGNSWSGTLPNHPFLYAFVLRTDVGWRLFFFLRYAPPSAPPFLHFVHLSYAVILVACSTVWFFLCKVSASGILKGPRSTLILRFFQKFLGQVCLIPNPVKSAKLHIYLKI